MDTMNLDDGQPAAPKTDAERQKRLAREAEGMARASAAAGYFATSAEVDAWIDSLDTGNLPPVTDPRLPRPR